VTDAVLYDAPGPRARRRTAIWTVVAAVVLLAIMVLAGLRLAENGQFDAEKWTPFVELPAVRRILLEGLRATLQAAAYGIVFALVVGTLLGVGRLSSHRWISWPCVVIIEWFRAIPLLLLMFFFYLGVPALLGVNVEPLWSVVFGLTLYNGAVIAEIIRAGVLALPRGQREAALAVGLRDSQTMRLVLLPQAFRIMLPALISQLVVLLKDSTLGFIIGYRDLLEVSGVIRRQLDNPLQVYFIIAVLFILVNSLLSWIAHRVEGRQRRKYGTRATITDDVEAGLERGPAIAVGKAGATEHLADPPPER
jgi:glutamate transport system permease protein